MNHWLTVLAGDAFVGWFWIPLGTVLHLLTVILVVGHCLTHRRESASSLLWIFLAWSFPILGALAYLSVGVYRVPAKAWKKRRSDEHFLEQRRAREDAAMPLVYWQGVHDSRAVTPDKSFAGGLNHALDAILPDFPLIGGNRITPLVCGDEAYPQMLDAIRHARQHIHLQTFMLGAGETGRTFLDALREKAQEGVTVRVMCDRFGSTSAFVTGLIRRYRHIPNMRVVGWTQANPIKRQFQINLRNHRKILVVDGINAFTGGLNIVGGQVTRDGKEAVRDYHFSVSGPIVQELQYSFLSDWYFMTEEDPGVLLSREHFPHIEPEGDALIRVVNGGPASELETLTDAFFAAITSARRELLAVTPYLVPTNDVVRALRVAALRGVDVRLIVPEKNNHRYAGLASRGLYGDLLSAGVRIFERRPPFIHAKALIVDNTFAIVGTANLDVRSLRLNYETNLAVYDDRFIDALKRIVLEDLAHSEQIDLAAWRRRPLSRRLLENFCGLMTPVL